MLYNLCLISNILIKCFLSEPPLDDLETVSAERNKDENLEKNKKKAKGNKTAKPKDYDEKG